MITSGSSVKLPTGETGVVINPPSKGPYTWHETGQKRQDIAVSAVLLATGEVRYFDGSVLELAE